ncbi:RsmB/NOP family class I SAM-dependent RNA methyltransferase [Xanthobacter tagetidis]|uniref:Methyltransferase domain-containing protein n=1 Tax=Xanthobacter tagetidis TaxID=60216 RepID=A0A3L7A590_9HYPH|nr:RsmB/NOP family class I SAM-dependent RNA methyltransferase [Xanthobacter tagetidis]MBB6308764.1 16S rRNA (cytosine967-C5)-methyltransferase [Xanthobacter tagetidis]RLP75469.1 methyltransferase domain-containing protein [Xanthobacter tagetidis]
MRPPSRPPVRSSARPPSGTGAPRRPSGTPPRPPAAPGLAARALAVDGLEKVLRHGAPLEEAAEGFDPALEPRDRALAFRIMATAVRRLGTLRLVLGKLLERGLPKSAPRLEAILLAGATQVLFMDVPDHAAVGLSVDLARTDRSTAGFAALANAVLRRLTREKEALLAGIDPLEADTPDWLRARWRTAYGAEAARAICAINAVEPPLDITVKSDPERWAQALSGEVLPTGSVRVVQAGPVRALPGFAEGEWWVQDAAAALPARLLGDVKGLKVADLCAAPGGKTAQLAAAGAQVTAVDRSGARIGRLKENLARLKLSAQVVARDVLEFRDGPFDAVLLDAPCSATGTLRRHPDIAITKRPGDVASLAELQGRLLAHAADLVRPGGTLVFSTCSLEPEEGEAQVERLLAARPDFARAPLAPGEIAGIDPFITPQGELRTLPSGWVRGEPERSGLDGFFATRLRRLR